MDTKLEQALTELINKTISTAETTKEFLEAEIPDVIYQLLMWHGIYNFILFCVGIALITVVCYFNVKQVKWLIKKTKEDRDFIIEHPELMFNILQMFLFWAFIETINFQWLKIWVAPKVWLLDYAIQVVK